MWVWQRLNALVVLIPIVSLFLVGIVVTLRSGVAGRSRGQDLRVLALNLTGLLLRVAGYLAGLVAVQRMIGAPMEVGW